MADVSYPTARKLLRKCRIMMAESNNEKILDSSFYEIDFIEVGGQREGKPGKGADWVGAPSAIFTVVVALLVIYANSKRYTERANDLKANCIDLDNLLKELEIDSVEKNHLWIIH